jgi:hypothetical protein
MQEMHEYGDTKTTEYAEHIRTAAQNSKQT